MYLYLIILINRIGFSLPYVFHITAAPALWRPEAVLARGRRGGH